MLELISFLAMGKQLHANPISSLTRVLKNISNISKPLNTYFETHMKHIEAIVRKKRGKNWKTPQVISYKCIISVMHSDRPLWWYTSIFTGLLFVKNVKISLFTGSSTFKLFRIDINTVPRSSKTIIKAILYSTCALYCMLQYHKTVTMITLETF